MSIFRTIGIVGSATSLLFSATVVFAEERSVTERQNIREPLKSFVDMKRGNASTTATTTRREMMEGTREHLQNIREEMRDRMKEQRGKAEQRLADIKDKVKQQMAERLAKQFEHSNSQWTDHFIGTLDRLDAILKKIQDRATIAASNGKDITTTTAAIASAKTAIATARTAVTIQAAKTYVLDPSTIPSTTSTTTPNGQEELMKGLRTSFKNLKGTLFKDLFALRNGPMTDARGAVHNAAQVLSKIRGVDEGNATSTTSTHQ